MRLGRSHLNAHAFAIGQSDTPNCTCGYKEESTSHYFLDCMQYSAHRQILFNLFELYFKQFKNMSRKKKLEILLNGYNIENGEFYYINCKLTYAVKK